MGNSSGWAWWQPPAVCQAVQRAGAAVAPLARHRSARAADQAGHDTGMASSCRTVAGRHRRAEAGIQTPMKEGLTRQEGWGDLIQIAAPFAEMKPLNRSKQ